MLKHLQGFMFQHVQLQQLRVRVLLTQLLIAAARKQQLYPIRPRQAAQLLIVLIGIQLQIQLGF